MVERAASSRIDDFAKEKKNKKNARETHDVRGGDVVCVRCTRTHIQTQTHARARVHARSLSRMMMTFEYPAASRTHFRWITQAGDAVRREKPIDRVYATEYTLRLSRETRKGTLRVTSTRGNVARIT